MLSFEIVRLIMFVLDIYTWVIIAAAVISWVTPNPYNPVVLVLRRLTEPVFAPLRRLLPPGKTVGIDFSPIIVILLIQWAIQPLLWTLVG